jgi:hypothetical protein
MIRTSARQGKRKITIQDLSRMPVVEVKNASTAGFEDWKQAAARVKAENAAAAAAATAATATAERNAELAKSASAAAVRQLEAEALLSEPSDVLIAKCPQSPMTAKNPDEYSAQMLTAIRKGLSGVTFDDAGKTTLMKVAGLNREHVNLTDARVWKILFNHMVELGVFEASGALAKPKPVAAAQPVAQPQPEPESYDSLLDRLDGDSRSGHKQLTDAAEMENFKAATPLCQEWLDHLYRDFKGFVPSDEDRKFILDVLFVRNNWSRTRPESYHMARRAMVAQHKWPDSMLTKAELLSREIENLPTNADYHTKQNLLQRLREAAPVSQ